MFNSNSGFTMPVVPQGSNDGFGGFGDNGAWWIIILILLFGGYGWGGRGFGGYGGSNGGVADGYVLTSDFANIERKLDGVNNGLCDGFYAQAQLINGVTQSIADSNYAVQNAITQTQINAMANQNALQTQIAGCCCDNKALLADVQYNMATQNCATNNTIATNFGNLRYEMAAQDCAIKQTVNDVGRNLSDVGNANTQAILAAIQSIKDDAKDDKIANLTAQVNALSLAASQQAQNNYLIDKLGMKAPVAAFSVPAPWQYTGCNSCGCNC